MNNIYDAARELYTLLKAAEVTLDHLLQDGNIYREGIATTENVTQEIKTTLENAQRYFLKSNRCLPLVVTAADLTAKMQSPDEQISHLLDFLYSWMDDAMNSNNTLILTDALNMVDVTKCRPEILVGYLTITQAIKNEPARQQLFDRIEKHITYLYPDRASRILVGLK